MKVVDSTFLIDVLRGRKEALAIVDEKHRLLTTQINMYEVIRGLFLRNLSRTKISDVMGVFERIRVIPLDDNAAIKAAEISAAMIKRGMMIADCDCLTAGTALSKGINIILTNNKKHFERIEGLKVETY